MLATTRDLRRAPSLLGRPWTPQQGWKLPLPVEGAKAKHINMENRFGNGQAGSSVCSRITKRRGADAFSFLPPFLCSLPLRRESDNIYWVSAYHLNFQCELLEKTGALVTQEEPTPPGHVVTPLSGHKGPKQNPLDLLHPPRSRPCCPPLPPTTFFLPSAPRLCPGTKQQSDEGGWPHHPAVPGSEHGIE